MKTKHILVGLLAIALLSLIGSRTYAEVTSYELSWWTVDGGGGTSSSSTYDVSGTIDQSYAGNTSGGDYALTGGFWGDQQDEESSGYNLYLPMLLRP